MSNYNVDTLENKIVVEAQEAIKSLQSIIGYVNQSKTAIDSMKSATGLKALDTQVKTTTSNLTKMQVVGNSLKKALNFSGILYGIKRVYGFLKSSAEASIDYVETLNLFEVSMGKTLDQYGNLDSVSSKYYTKALKFQRELNERFGTNIEETMRYQALYNQMSESMGINDDASYVISENLTKLGIDLASLFNKSEADTMEALRAGVLAGQTKPLRNYGLDVTQQTLAPLVSELGIDRSVKQLSQAEKMILRYIAVLRQASSAHGDFAKTIESPANQLKVFRQQLAELKTAIGNLFQGILGQILPYVNAVLMVIKELIKMLGNLFGFEVSSSSTNLADQTGIEDLETGLGGAVGRAKELRAQLMGFDEINNITTDTGSGGAGGGASSTGIDSKLLDAMKEYDNLMDKVRMKATEIKDRIMEWLGFTGDVEEDTKRLKEILDTIEIILKTIVGAWIGTKLVGFIGSIITMLGTTGLTGVIGKLQGAIILMATSWGTAKLAAKEYVKFFTDDPEGNALLKAMGYSALSVGSGAGAGALIGAVIGSVVPVVGTAVGSAVGALIGGTSAMAFGVDASLKESEQYILNNDLKELLDRDYESYKEHAKNAKLVEKLKEQGIISEDADAYDMDDYNQFTQNYKDIWNFGSDEFSEEASRMIEMYRNLALAEVDLFDNGGERIDNYYNKYVNLVNEIVGSSDSWVNLHNSYLEHNEALEDAGTNLDTFLTKLGNSAYETTAEDISKLNSILDEMTSYVKASGDAFVDSAILSTNSLKEEGYISTQTADKVVANAIRKAEAEGDAFNSYQLKLKDYTTQLQKGLITQEEYNTLVGEAKTEYEKAKNGADATATAVKFLNERISDKIDLGNWQEAIEYTDKLGGLYTENAEKLKTNYDAELEYYNDQIAWTEDLLETTKRASGEESEAYKEIEEELEALKEARTSVTEQYEDDVQSLKETVYRSLKTIEQQLIDSGYDIEEDAQGLYKAVQDQLNKIGLDTEIAENIDKELKGLNTTIENSKPGLKEKMNEISSIIKGLGPDFKLQPKIDVNPQVSLQVSNLKTKLINLRDSISGLSGGIIGAGIQSALNASISKLNLLGYASGGFPSMGEIFMARESGPELVGKIGSRTAVANNSQIVEAVSNGVYTAVAEAMSVSNNNGSMKISAKLNGKELIQFTIDGINGIKQQTGECPIEVL